MLIAIVIIIMIFFSSLSIFFYQSIQSKKILIARATADKDTYSPDDNVTFKVQLETLGKDFYYKNEYSGPEGPYVDCYGVNIARITSSLSPSELIDREPNSWIDYSKSSSYVKIDAISSEKLTMTLEWNRTIKDTWVGKYYDAPAGVYCLIPCVDINNEYSYKALLTEDNFFTLEGPTLDAIVTFGQEERKLLGTITVGNPGYAGHMSAMNGTLTGTAYLGLDGSSFELNESINLNVNETKDVVVKANCTLDDWRYGYFWVNVKCIYSTDQGSYLLLFNMLVYSGEVKIWYRQ
ncbi:MAG: hypothetical protein A4E32_01534 [Methanomassiliicoccales archaeon PtaU1.Bin124]|nr:MAG: hypothetical protein A4E32_01534 [Methanomassiliicoccales archaeon PtaU1.Bin124]